MNPKETINITSERYGVTGRIEDYGVSIKLIFAHNGLERTIGIMRPWEDDLAEKCLKIMETTIKRLSAQTEILSCIIGLLTSSMIL